MTNYNVVFKDSQYRAVAQKAAKYYQESAKSAVLPMVDADEPDADEYRYTNLTDPKASYAGSSWGQGTKAFTLSDFADIDLFTQQCNITLSNDEIRRMGSGLLADKKEAIISKWALDVDDAIIHGPKNMNGIQLAEGLLGQLTCMVDQSSGGDHDCSTKGEIWLWLTAMIDGIPLAMREEGPDMLLFINEKSYSEAHKPDRIYQDKIEWDFIYEELIGPKAVHGRKIGQVILTNKINAEATDATNGNNANTVDTLGTHGRMLLIVPEPRWVGRVTSRGFDLIGEDRNRFGIEQTWGWKGRGYFFNTDCAEYTEALTF